MILRESFQFLVRSVFNLISKPTLTKSGFRLRAVTLAASCGVLLVGCGGGSVTENPMGNEPTPAEDEDETARMKMEEEQKAAQMAATAAKLFAGISFPTATDATPEANIRFAAYNSDEDAIDVQNGVATADAQELSEDKKTTVAANHGWEGKRYTASGTGVAGTYEAMVYSTNVGEPEEGDPFNVEYTLNAADADNPGELPITSDVARATARIYISSFSKTAGNQEFELPDNVVRVMLPGSYHGVSGTYYCTPVTSNTCAIQVAAEGLTLGGRSDDNNAFTESGGTWTFKPGTPTAKVLNVADAYYASYGWWIHTDEDGNLSASAFVDNKDGDTATNVPAATGVTALQGTATYRGGAAGKYALSSSTGGTNDAGHFTARATLQADFSKNVSANGITGTIDQFVGADGKARDWEVELMGSAISNGGLIRALNDDGTTEPLATDSGAMTKWTIGGTAGSASGQWTASLQVNSDGGVPTVGTGTFHSMYGPGNSMIGAFGVNEE